MLNKESVNIDWIPLKKYCEEWAFLGSGSAYRVAEQIGAIDYLVDIKKNLPNYKLIQRFHERIILISLGAFFEYGLKRAAQLRLEHEKMSHAITKTFNMEKEERKLQEEGMEATINRLNEANLLDRSWVVFLHRVKVLRDEVHMDKDRDKNIEAWLKEIGITGIRNKIDDFRELIHQILGW